MCAGLLCRLTGFSLRSMYTRLVPHPRRTTLAASVRLHPVQYFDPDAPGHRDGMLGCGTSVGFRQCPIGTVTVSLAATCAIEIFA